MSVDKDIFVACCIQVMRNEDVPTQEAIELACKQLEIPKVGKHKGMGWIKDSVHYEDYKAVVYERRKSLHKDLNKELFLDLFLNRVVRHLMDVEPSIAETAEELGYTRLPSHTVVQKWMKQYGYASIHKQRTVFLEDFSLRLSEFMAHNLVFLEDAILAVAECLECAAPSINTISPIRRRLGLRLRAPKIECFLCNKDFEPRRADAIPICSSCRSIYGKSVVSLYHHGKDREYIISAVDDKRCRCGTIIEPGCKQREWCRNCYEDLNTDDRTKLRNAEIIDCPCCTRRMYATRTRPSNNRRGTQSCEHCRNSLSPKEIQRRRMVLKNAKRTTCLCGNPFLQRKTGTRKLCSRCLTTTKISKAVKDSWTKSSPWTRCAHCYERMDKDSPSRFCTKCLDEHTEETLIWLCRTEEMKEEDEVKAYNKEFMRKHTRMLNRNKPRKKSKPKEQYKPTMIEDLHNLAVLESLSSSIKESTP